jgi:hypothetical protein
MVMACPFFKSGCGWNSGRLIGTLKLYFTPGTQTSIVIQAGTKFDANSAGPYNGRLPVMHFLNLMKSFASPAGTRWAALLYGAGLRARNLLT